VDNVGFSAEKDLHFASKAELPFDRNCKCVIREEQNIGWSDFPLQGEDEVFGMGSVARLPSAGFQSVVPTAD
jgi:hypothetical protein